MKNQRDVIITGGGLAGLSLALQLKTARPELDILVLEKAFFPRPRSTAKVGESTVEIAAHWLTRELGLGQHLHDDHLYKFGLRFFFGKPQADFSMQDELGASKVFDVPTYQLDRGDIENHLAEKVQSVGVEVLPGSSIQQLNLDGPLKQVRVRTPDAELNLSCRWLLDAAGRASLIKNDRGLAKDNDHRANAVWFRVDRRIILDDWSDNQAWRDSCQPPGQRWLSTNHLIGPGYWAWVIPLGSGNTSVGIVMDDQALEESGITDVDTAMAWLRIHQPRYAEAIEGANFLDFVCLRNYSYDCKQVFDGSGWGMTGEAGRFADPFYSPGSDFIAMGNSFLVDLVTSSFKGEDVTLRAMVYDKIFKSIYDNTISLYTGIYGGFGDRRLMGLKLLWDYTYYWGVLSLLFFRRVFTNVEAVRRFNPMLLKAQALNQQIQAQFRIRAARRLVLPCVGVFLDQYKIPCLQHFNAMLRMDENRDCGPDLEENMVLIEQVAAAVLDMLDENAKPYISPTEEALLGDYRLKVLA